MQTRIHQSKPALACDGCGSAIAFQQPFIHIEHSLQRCHPDEGRGGPAIEVAHGESLLALCASCSGSFTVTELTTLLRSELQRRLTTRN